MKRSQETFELPELPCLHEDERPGLTASEPRTGEGPANHEIFSAELASLPPASVLEMMERTRTTGVVTFDREGESIQFGLQDGAVLWALGSPRTRFGECVRRLHGLDDSDIQHALQLQRSGSRRQPLGCILVGLGVAPANVIAMAVVEQAFEVLAEVLGWTGGRCTVVPLEGEYLRMPHRERTELWPLLLRASQDRGTPPPREVPKVRVEFARRPAPAARRLF